MNTSPSHFHQTWILFAAVWSGLAALAVADPPARDADDPRVTPTVKLVRKILPAVVSVRVERKSNKPNVTEYGHGGGSVIHADGYILTNSHVVKESEKVEVAFFQGDWLPARIIARLPSEDLALIKVDTEKPLPVLPLGRSEDLELGEPVVTLGSPGGLPHSLSSGLISGLSRATNTENAHLPSMVQTTAAISGGSSGGALINALGQQIGVITSRKSDGENLGFAITIDRVREVFPRMMAVEQRLGITHGLTFNMLQKQAHVTAITKGSPAAQAKLQVDDVITAIDEKPLNTAVDFYLALAGHQAGETLQLNVRRAEKELTLPLQLGAAEQLQPVTIDKLKPGLRVSRYEGQWEQLPEFDDLQPVETVVMNESPHTLKDVERDAYGERFTGFIKISKPGVYYLITRSDDGSRLWIADKLIVDNDGLHSQQEVAGLARLEKGLYPLRIEYFDAGGDQSLEVLVESPEGQRQKLPSKWLFHEPQ